MLIGLVSDTHVRDGRPVLPERLVETFRRCDLILHAGDIGDLSGLEMIKAIGPEVVAISGNTDRSPLDETLPEFRLVETPAGSILVIHSLPLVREGPKAAIGRFLGDYEQLLAVVHGHTHCPDIDQVELSDGRRVWLVNPGSPTRSRGYGHTFAMMELGRGEPQVWIEKL
ncbi:MAG: YfcE family phosphodiesterase [Anaerolineaceae bacterium]|nr:YfcE family phosphodiesterase [Anaerolineaceae bacterium]